MDWVKFFFPFPLCEVDAVHLGFRLSCFTPMPLCNSREGFTATWTTTCAVKTVRCLRVFLGTSSALELELGIPITSFTYYII